MKRGYRAVTRLFGRESELNMLHGAIARAGAGEPIAIIVEGDAGMGKTTLLDAAVDGEDVLVLRVTGDETEVDLDFGVVEQLVRCAPLDRPTRDRLLPSLDSDPVAVGAALLRTVDDLDLDRPLVVVIDDAHLADVPSLTAITFALRRLRADPVVLVIAMRPEGRERIPLGLGRLAERSGGVVNLGVLDLSAIADLAAGVYGQAIPHAAAERLHAHTGGHPLHTRALLHQLDYRDVVTRPELPAPRSFASLVASQLASCSDEAQQFAVALSVLGSPAPITDVATVGDLEHPLAAADELVAAGLALVTERPTSVVAAFSHALIRASVYDDLSSSKRAAVHAVAATVTTGGEALRHRLAATTGLDDDLADELATVATGELVRGARRSAAAHLLGAARVAARRSDRERYVLEATEQLLLAGQPLGELADEIDTFADTARRNYVAGRVALARGEVGCVRALLGRAWDLAQRDPAEAAALGGPIAELLSVSSLGTMPPDEVLTWARRGLAGGDGTVSAMMICHALAQAGRLDVAFDEMTALLGRTTSRQQATDARLGRGIVGVWRNDLEQARRDLGDVLASPAEASLIGHVHASSYLAGIELRLGRLAEAVDLAETTVGLIEDADSRWLEPLPRTAAAVARARLGDFDEARHHAAAISQVADVTGMRPARVAAEHAWLAIATAACDHDEVVAGGDRIIAARFDAIPDGVFRWRASYAESLAATGRIDDARAAAESLGRAARGHADVSSLAEAARAVAAVAIAEGDDEEATRAFEEGLSLDAIASRPFERARLELAAGEFERRSGRRTNAAALLECAARRFEQMGSGPWSERAERELAACGLRPMKRSRTDVRADLTAQERAVASLVACGRTNREVADQLIISVKTVEHHLSRAYAKLGVRSRTELAARGFSNDVHP